MDVLAMEVHAWMSYTLTNFIPPFSSSSSPVSLNRFPRHRVDASMRPAIHLQLRLSLTRLIVSHEDKEVPCRRLTIQEWLLNMQVRTSHRARKMIWADVFLRRAEANVRALCSGRETLRRLWPCPRSEATTTRSLNLATLFERRGASGQASR